MEKFLYKKEIFIDDSGWGDLILGVVIGALNLPERRYMDRRIPLSSFQPPNFQNKRYLDDAVKIAQEIEIGVKKTGKEYIIITDRVKAIEYALEKAEAGDILLIAGKGPENEQIYQNRVLHHNDEEVVRNILTGRQKIGKL